MILGSGGSRVLIAGTGSHPDGSTLPDVPAVAATVAELRRVFAERCGLTDRQLGEPVLDPTHTEFGDALSQAASEAEGVLLFYYVGHGIVSPSNELFLATRETDHHTERLHRALPYSIVEQAISRTAARTVVVVLDCCFAGRAELPARPAAVAAVELAARGGAYVLAAASGEERALAVPGEPYTAFSAALITVLREGDPAGLPDLTIEGVYRYLRRTLPAQGLPAPSRRLAERADDLVLASNPAATAHTVVRRPRPPAESRCPYQGLESFTADEAGLYFGRADLTSHLLTRLSEWSGQGGPVAVVGASGVGKSSLLRAGVLPAIARGELDVAAVQTWPQWVLTPGERPIAALAARLAEVSDRTFDDLRADIAADPAGFGDLLLRTVGSRVLLAVDQAEELFSLCHDDAERRGFLRAVGSAADGAALVLFALRADFYGHCLDLPELADALARRQVVVTPMSADSLREAIEKPAHAVNLELEAGLADLVLHDLGDLAEGALPLLSYALLRTWQERDGATLTLSGYRAAGGVWEAVTRKADSVHDALDDAGREAMRRILLRMVSLGERTQDTRRRVSLADLSANIPAADAALAALAEARLVTVDDRDAQISHDALLRAWPLLRTWIDTDRAGLLIHQKLSDSARSWRDHNRDSNLLYRGDQLQLAENWAREHARDIDELEAEFLAASRVARRSRRRVRIGLGSLLGLLLVVALVMSGFAYNGQRQARAQQHTAVARELVQRADALRDKAPQLALMLGIAADHVDHTRSTTAAMLESLLTPYLGTLSASSVTAVEYSADGRLLAAADMDNRVTLWNENRKLGHLVSAFAPDALAFSSDGRTLAVGGPGSAAFWDISDAARPRRIADLGGIGAVTNVVFSPDGRLLATMNGVDHTAAVWDVGEQPHPRRLSDVNGDTDVGYDAAFSPDGRLLATTGKSQAALWDVSAPERPQRLAALPAAATTGIFSVAFRPDGRVLATDDDTAVNLWDVTDPVQPKRTYRLTDAQDNIAQVRFTAAGDMVYAATASDALCSWTLAEPARIRGWACTAGKGHRSRKALNPAVLALASGNATDNTITLWGGADSTWWLPLQTAQRHSAVGNVEFSGDGRLLATRQADGTATLWDSDGNRRRFIPVVSFPSDTVKALVLSADRTLVTLDRQGGIALWDASDPHRPVTRARLDTEGIRYSAPLASNSRRRMLAVHGQESAVQLWDISDPRKAQRRGIIPADDREVRSVTFSPDGRTLAVGGGDGRVALWDVADPGRPRRRGRVVGQDGGSIRSLAFSPDGRTLASGGAAATVTLWDVGDRDDPQLLGAPLSHRGGDIRALGFSPDGRLVAAGAGDELNLWDVSDPVHPRVVLTDTTHRAPVRTVAFSSDGRTLASGSDDMSIQIRDLTHISETRENAHELACARTGRGLNPAEWRQYIPSLPFQRTCPNPPE